MAEQVMQNKEISKPITSHKMLMELLCGNFAKSFLEWEKMASRKIFQHFLHTNFFIFIPLISNHQFSLFNLVLICTCESFKKLKLHSPKQLVQLFENSLGQINSKLTLKPNDSLYQQPVQIHNYSTRMFIQL